MANLEHKDEAQEEANFCTIVVTSENSRGCWRCNILEMWSPDAFHKWCLIVVGSGPLPLPHFQRSFALTSFPLLLNPRTVWQPDIHFPCSAGQPGQDQTWACLRRRNFNFRTVYILSRQYFIKKTDNRCRKGCVHSPPRTEGSLEGNCKLSYSYNLPYTL